MLLLEGSKWGYRRDRKAVVLYEGSGLGYMMHSSLCCCLGDLSGDAGRSCVTIEGIFVGYMWTEGLCCYLVDVGVSSEGTERLSLCFRDVGQRGQLVLEGCECEYKGYRGSVSPLQGSG